jgi:hypothetical protein
MKNIAVTLEIIDFRIGLLAIPTGLRSLFERYPTSIAPSSKIFQNLYTAANIADDIVSVKLPAESLNEFSEV